MNKLQVIHVFIVFILFISLQFPLENNHKKNHQNFPSPTAISNSKSAVLDHTQRRPKKTTKINQKKCKK
jgi:hypothetical protein